MQELYEPLWEDLYLVLKARGQAIQGIWIADAAHQGMSGILNDGKLGNDPSWADHPRDLLHMINHFRKEMSRPLIGIGHSMGGCHLVDLSLIHPRLLSTLILIDPVIQASAAVPVYSSQNFSRQSTFRRDMWPSRSEAVSSMTRSKFYQAWDSRVLNQWIKYGLRDLPTATYPSSIDSSKPDGDKPVTLATSKHQEVFTYVRPIFDEKHFPGKQATKRITHPDLDPMFAPEPPFYNAGPIKAFANLPYVRPSALYIFGGRSALSSPDLRKQKMERTGTGVGGSGGKKEGRVKEVLLEDAGHLIPMENVGGVVHASAEWVIEELENWRASEEDWGKRWAAMSRSDKTMISEEWREKIGGDPRGKTTEKL